MVIAESPGDLTRRAWRVDIVLFAYPYLYNNARCECLQQKRISKRDVGALFYFTILLKHIRQQLKNEIVSGMIDQ